MLTRLKFERGEGVLIEPNPQVSSRKPHIPQASLVMAHEEGHEGMSEDERTFRKMFFEMYEMVKVIFEEINTGLQGVSSNPPKGNEGNGDKPTPSTTPFSSPPSSSSYSSTSTPSNNPPRTPKGHGKTPLLKYDVKFEFPMYNRKLNAQKLDNWVRQLEVYCKIQKIDDDSTKIHLASLMLEGTTLIWWEAKTEEVLKKSGKIISSWNDSVATLRRQFYQLAYMQKIIMD